MYEIQIVVEGKWKPLHPPDGKPYRYKSEEEARHILEMCYPDQMREFRLGGPEFGRVVKVGIMNVEELAAVLGWSPSDIGTYPLSGTKCSILLAHNDKGISLAAYCAGVDANIKPTFLEWGFTSSKFWRSVQETDDEGVALWNRTHGCSSCGDEDNTGYVPVNNDCTECKGDGNVA